MGLIVAVHFSRRASPGGLIEGDVVAQGSER